MKGETGGHDRRLRGEVKRSSVSIKYSQVFPRFRIPSFPTGRPAHRVSANVEIHCLYTVCGRVCVCTLCIQAHMYPQPSAPKCVCADDTHGGRVACSRPASLTDLP